MNILVTGSGASGSWQVRGVQLGAAIGATVLAKALDVAAFDLAVVVKRPPADVVQRIHRAGVPLVWDVVDAWPQPAGNSWPREHCLEWLRGQVQAIKPAAIVAATRAMAADCEEFGLPVLALPHHSRPGLSPAPIRPAVRTVGYEGCAQQIGGWRLWLDRECERRGWAFVVNPVRLDECDILVALRDPCGYAPRSWKSNVKMANAQAAGIPLICGREAGYLENASGGELFADTSVEVRQAFDALYNQQARRAAADKMAQCARPLPDVAARYAPWLHEVAWSTVPSC